MPKTCAAQKSIFEDGGNSLGIEQAMKHNLRNGML